MDYSLLVGIHDCERDDRYADHLYYAENIENPGYTDGSPIEEESGITSE